MRQQLEGNAALAIPDEQKSGTELVVVPRKAEILSYELAGALAGRSRQWARENPDFEHVRDPRHKRYVGVTVRSYLRSHIIQNDEQRAVAYYERGGDPISVVSELGIPLRVAEKVWQAFQRLHNDERVQAARASREKASCVSCGRTKRQAQATRAVLESRGTIASSPTCDTCSEPIESKETDTTRERE